MIKQTLDIESICLRVYAINNYKNTADATLNAVKYMERELENIPHTVNSVQTEIDNIRYLDDVSEVDIDLNIDLNISHSEIDYEYNYITSKNTNYDKLSDAISEEIEIDLPYVKTYYFKFRKQLDSATLTSGWVSSFDKLTEAAYNHPLDFECGTLTEEEQEYIDAVLALKVAEKLEQ